MDEALAAHLWIYEDAGLAEQERHDHLVLEALLHLGTTVYVSERGLGTTTRRVRCTGAVGRVAQN